MTLSCLSLTAMRYAVEEPERFVLAVDAEAFFKFSTGAKTGFASWKFD